MIPARNVSMLMRIMAGLQLGEPQGHNGKEPHWLRNRRSGKGTKNGRYYQKRIEKRRKKAGR